MELVTLFDILTFVAVVVVGVITYLNRARGVDTLTVEGVGDAITEAGNIWEDAQGYVAAAEQLYIKGRIDEESRFHYVLDRLKRDYPDLDTDMLVNAIEAGVYFLKTGVPRRQERS